MLRGAFALLLSLGLAVLLGCDQAGTSSTLKVTGKVTYKGQPLAGVNVIFTPESGGGGGRPATGTTDAAGQFTLSTSRPNDGAVPGKHIVTITPGPSNTPPMPMPGTPEAASAAAAPPPFPAKYSDPKLSGLTAEVKQGSANNFTFELTD